MTDLFLALGFPPDVGGIQRLVFEVASRFPKPIIVTRFFKGSEQLDPTLKHFTIYRSPAKRSLLYRALFVFSPLVAWLFENKRNIDLAFASNKISRVHCTHIFTALSGLYAKYRYGVPYMIIVHCQEVFPFYYPWYNPLAWFLRNIVLKKADRVYTITNKMADYLAETIDRRKITVIPLAADPKCFKPLRRDKKLIARYGLTGKKVVLTTSRFEPYKGIDKTLEAIAKISGQLSNVHYLVVGDGPDKKRLQSITTNLGLESKVTFTGNVPDAELPKLYNLCDVYILANRDVPAEGQLGGYGLVLFEANASGKPVVVGRAKYFDNEVIEGKGGLIVDPFNVDEIARALLKILKNKKFAAKLGTAGRKQVLQRMNYDSMARVIIAGINENNIGPKVGI